jgi:ABC-2 type transport system ATP-binding protein
MSTTTSKENSELPIQIRSLRKTFPLKWRKGSVVAIDGLDLEVQRGEVFGLLGPNGSGKSTTLKVLLGLLRPTSGEARLFGESVATVASRRRLGYLPESPYFYKFLSGEETLKFFGRLCGMQGADLQKRIDELIELVGLQHGRHRPLSGYSKGMLQRIGLAQALLHDPELLLLDEPTAGVDPLGSREMKDLILELKARGKTIVLSSHLLDQVEQVCDRVAILHLGKKILEGRLSELLTRQGKVTITLSDFDEKSLPQIRSQLESLKLKVEEIEPPKMTLEELFLQRVAQSSLKASTQKK